MMDTFGAQLRSWRLARRVSQEQLAARAGVSSHTEAAMRRAILMAVLACGCSGSRGGDGGGGSSEPPTCRQAVSHASEVLGRPADVEKQTGACEQEGWDVEVRRCLASAQDRDAVVRCVELLPEQEMERARAKRRPSNEAILQLDKIGKRAMIEYVTNAAYPLVGAPLTPAVDCCTQNAGGKRRCAAVAADWDTPEWRALDFSVDRDFSYQYSYEPLQGGAKFVARAVGDLDCDGNKVIYEIRGTAVNGNPKTQILEPPPSSD